MKNKILSMFLLPLTLLLGSCSSELSTDEGISTADRSAILRLDIQKEDISRGVITSSNFEDGDSIFVFLSYIRKNTLPDDYHTYAVYSGGEWKMAQDFVIPEDYEVVVSAYYPYSACERWGQFSVRIKEPLSQTDILYGYSQRLSISNPVANIQCRHMETRLTFALYNNSDSPIDITKMSVTTEGEQLFLGSLGEIEDEYKPIRYTQDYSMDCNIKIPVGETANLDFLLPPTVRAYEQMQDRMADEGISKTILKFSLDAGDRTIKFDLDANAWKSGIQYIYPVRIDSETNWKSIITNGDANNGPSENCLVFDNGYNGYVEASVVDNPSGEGKVFSAPIIAQEEGVSIDQRLMLIKFNQSIEEGTELKVSFNYYCTDERSITTMAFGVDNQYFNYHTWGILGSFEAKPEWQSIEKTFTVTAEQASVDGHPSNEGLQVIGLHFPLSPDSGIFYINNIKVEAFLEGKK